MINGFKKIDVEMSRMFRFWSPVDGMCFRKSCGTNNGLRLSQDIKRRARWKNPYYFRCRGRKGNVALGVAYAEGDVNVCVMVSGGGSNLKALHHASIQNKLGGGKIKVHDLLLRIVVNSEKTNQCKTFDCLRISILYVSIL